MSVNKIKKTYYKWLTTKKAGNTINRLKEDISNNKDLIVVHQMGRAASMTVTNTVKSMNLSMPVYHTHWLNSATVENRMGRIDPDKGPLNVRVSQLLSPQIYQHKKDRNWKFISIIRDPVARNISAYFLSIDHFFDDFFRRYKQGDITLDDLLHNFLKEFPHDQPIKWFDEEVKEPIGIDVFEVPFDNRKGFIVVEHENVSFLTVKLERLNDVYQDALNALFHKKTERLVNTHVTNEDKDFDMYKEFISNIPLPKDYLEEMYASKYATHFYDDVEINGFKNKWLKE